MPSSLTDHARDSSTYAVALTFRDESAALVVPSAATWTLTDDAGTVINGRVAVAISPASSVTLVLAGADIAYADGARRVLTIDATYSSSLGTGLHLRDQILFVIDDLLTVV